MSSFLRFIKNPITGILLPPRWGGNIKLSILTIFCSILLIFPVRAETTPPELQGSGLPIPRFVSISSGKAFVRSGPAPRYPIKWIYKKDGFPVEIIQEFDVWRKVRDVDGDEGWINKALLSDKRFVIVQGSGLADMREDPAGDARVTARAEPGVVARLEKCDPEWCNVSAGGFSGWMQRKILWGIYAQEEIN
jgi:SH3-like domain-containing protein